jgi:hypothetical protein
MAGTPLEPQNKLSYDASHLSAEKPAAVVSLFLLSRCHDNKAIRVHEPAVSQLHGS